MLLATALLASVSLSHARNWSAGFAYVKWLDPAVSDDGANYLLKFTLKTALPNTDSKYSCGLGPNNSNITLRVPIGEAGFTTFKSWQASLLTAISSNKPVHILFDDDVCYAWDILLCSDGTSTTTCPAPN
jgi:hypothetical protein